MRYAKYLIAHARTAWPVARNGGHVWLYVGSFAMMVVIMPVLIVALPSYRAQINEWWENSGH